MIDSYALQNFYQALERSKLNKRSAVQVFRPFNRDENPETLLFRIAILLRLDEAFPDLLVNGSGLVNRGGAIEARNAALRQHSGLPQLRFPEEHRDLRSILQVRVRRALAPFPQGEMPIVEHHGTTPRGHLCKPIRQHRGNQANI